MRRKKQISEDEIFRQVEYRIATCFSINKHGCVMCNHNTTCKDYKAEQEYLEKHPDVLVSDRIRETIRNERRLS